MSSIKPSIFRELFTVLRISIFEVVYGSVLLTIIIIPTIFSSVYVSFFNDYPQENVYELIRTFINKFFDISYIGAVGTFIVWALFGLIVYCLIWILTVIFVDARNNIVISEAFIHPDSFHKSNYWSALLMRRVLYFFIMFGSLLFLIFLISVIPVLISSFVFIKDELFDNTEIALASLIVPFMWLIGWHILVIMRRLLLISGSDD